MEDLTRYYKDSNGTVYAYDDEQVAMGLADDKTAMTPEEVESHKNPPKTPEQLANEARLWRDAELLRADIEVNKASDASSPREVDWRQYRVALREWPQDAAFPDAGGRPVAHSDPPA